MPPTPSGKDLDIRGLCRSWREIGEDRRHRLLELVFCAANDFDDPFRKMPRLRPCRKVANDSYGRKPTRATVPTHDIVK